MAKGVELGVAYLTLAASTRGFVADIGKGLAQGEKEAAKSGKRMGKAIKDGIESAKPVDTTALTAKVKADQERLAAAVQQSSRKQEDATRKVEIAHQRLKEVRDKYAAGSSQVLAAEDRFRQAINKSKDVASQARASQEMLTMQVSRSKQELAEAEQKNRELAKATKQAADEAEAAAKRYSGFGGAIRKAIDEARNAFKGGFGNAFGGVKSDGDSAAGSLSQSFGESAEKSSSAFAEKFSGAFKGLVGAGVAAGVALGASVTNGIANNLEQSGIKAKMSASLALPPADAELAGKVTADMYKLGFSESYEGVAKSVTAVISSIPNVTDNEQQFREVTRNILAMSDAMGIEATASAGALTTMISSGLVKDGVEGTKVLAAGIQKIPEAFRGEAIDAFHEYADEFSAMGYTGEEAMAMLAAGAQQGQYGIDKTADAIKEFQIKATDGSKASADAFAAIGLDATSMSNKLLEGGDTAKGAMSQIIDGLLGIKDPSAQAQAAIGLFGTPLEDMGVTQIPSFLEGLQSAQGGLGDFQNAAQQMSVQLIDSDAARIEQFKRTISQGWADAVSGLVHAMVWVVEAIMPIREFLISTADKWGPFAAGLAIAAAGAGLWAAKAAIASGATIAWGLAAKGLASTLAFISSPITLTVAAIGLLIGAIIYAYNHFEWFKNVVNSAWTLTKAVTAAFVAWWQEVAWPAIVTGLQWIGDKFVWLYVNVVQPVWGMISSVVGGFINWLVTVAVPGVAGALQTLGGWFRWLNDTIIQPVWYGIRVTIAVAVAIIMTIFQGLIWLLKNTVGAAFMMLWTHVINPVFTWIAEKIGSFFTWFSANAAPAISGTVSAMGGFFQALWATVSAVFSWIWGKIGGFVGWLRDVASPIIGAAVGFWKAVFHTFWTMISTVFGWVWGKIGGFVSWLRDVVSPIISATIGFWKAVFHTFWTMVSNVFNWSRSKIQAFATWFRENISPYIKWGIELLKQAFHALWEKVSTVWSWIASKISRVWNWILETVLKPAMRWIRETFGPVWDWIAEKIGRVWDWISDKISGTWNWIRDNVFSPMSRYLKGDLVNVFRHAKDDIGRIWDGIKEKVYAPVQKVIDVVINDGFIKNYNKVAKKFNVNPLDEIKMPGYATGGVIGEGFARGGVLPGYQAHKKDEILTPMRKGEGVLVPEVVQGLGPEFVHRLNDAGNNGGIRAVKNLKSKMGLKVPSHGDHRAAGPGTPIYGGRQHSFSNAFQHQIAQMGQMSVSNGGVSSKWAVDSAAASWNGMSGVKLTNRRQPGVPHLTAVPASGVWWAGYYNGGNDIQLNESQGFASPKSNRLVTAHEIGHALGLGHTMGYGIKSIMDYGSMYSLNGPSGADAKALQAIYPGGSGQGYSGSGDEGFSIAELVKDTFKKLVRVPVDKALGAFKNDFKGNHFVDIGVGAVNKTIDDAINFVTKFGEGGEETGGNVSGSARDWMTKALKMKGLFSESNLESGVRRLMQESGGNVKAINNWDINALAGNSSRGVMQVIPTTFEAFKEAGHGDIWNPIDNILASINYTLSRYGSLRAGWDRAGGYALGGIIGDKPGLYDDGGLIQGKGLRLIDHQRSTPDYVLTERQWEAIYKVADRQVQTNHTGQNISVTVPEREGLDPSQMGTRIAESLAFELNKMGV